MHTRKNNQTNNAKQFTNENPSSDEMKNTIKTLEELPNYIEKINQKIQHIEKSISKKELDTNRVKAFIQSHNKDNSKLVSERCDNNELKSPSRKLKQNTDALALQSIVKASIENINDVLNFDTKDRQRRAKLANQHETLSTKSAYAKAAYKKKINEPLYNEKYKKEDKQKRMKLDISSDNLNSLFIQNKRSALKNNSYIDNNSNNNNNNSKGYYRQNTFVHNASVNNGNGPTSGSNVKTDVNMDDLSNFLETNEPNPSFLKINKIDKTTSTNRPSKSPYNSNSNCNSNNKNYQFKPKVKHKDNDVFDADKQYSTNNSKGVVSMISPKHTNKSKNAMNPNYNSNVNLKHNKSFIIDKVNTINNIHNNNPNANHYKLNKPTPKKFTSFKGSANSKKPHTAHSKKENEPSAAYKKSDLAPHNPPSKANPLKTSSNYKNTPGSIRDEASIYYKDIPKQIKNEDLLYLMLFFNEYIISRLPRTASKNTKDAFNSYSLALSRMIPASAQQVRKVSDVGSRETEMKVKKVIGIQRKWREFKVKQIASNGRMNLNSELKKMLINNFIEKEGFGIRKILGMLNTSVESFAQLKTKDVLVAKLKCINSRELSDDERSAMYKNYINSKLNVFNTNCRGNTIFNANDDCNYNALLSSVNDINDITQ